MSRRALAAIIVSLLLLVLVLVAGVLFAIARLTGGVGPAQVEARAPQYPIPTENTATDLLAAAAAVYADRGAIARALEVADAGDPAVADLPAKHDKDIKRAAAALAGQCLLPKRPYMDGDAHYWTRLRNLCRLFVLRGRRLEDEGRYKEAVQNHLQVLRLAEVCSRNGAAIGALVGVSMVVGAAEGSERCIAAAAAHGEGKGLPARLKAIYDRRVTDEQTLLEEWAQGVAGIDVMAGEVARQQGAKSAAPGLVKAWFRRSMNKALMEQLPETRKPYWERAYAAERDDALSAPGLVLMGARYAAEAARRDAVLLGCQVLAAVELYRHDKGAPPQRLEDLVPEYLHALPLDPFTGKPFGYQVAGKEYRLYSAGPDKVDGGGKRRVDSETEQGDIILWPAGRVTVKSKQAAGPRSLEAASGAPT